MKRSTKFLIPIAIGMVSCTSKLEEKPNILWITHEDLSPVYGCYGDGYATTPTLDSLAEKSIVYTQAFSNAPICAPARSTLITGMYATSLGTQHLRSEIPIPYELKILPEVLREKGYYTTNNAKTDYNFSPEGRWDESNNEAHWRNRQDDQPFFSVFNFGITHEGHTNRVDPEDTRSIENLHDPDLAELPPYLPDSPEMRAIWAHKYDLLTVFDKEVEKLINQLKEDELLENTIIFVFSDHGTGLPGGKRWLNNSGLQVPFILHLPEKYENLIPVAPGNETNQMVGFVDFAPTVLEVTGTEIPEMMEGKPFLGKNAADKDFIFGYRDRADDCYDMSRAVYDGRYMYVRHFMPQLPYFQNAVIFNKSGSYEEIHRLKNQGKLPEATQKMFERKPVEELFDLKNDPYEQNNLIGSDEVKEIREELSEKMEEWIVRYRDSGFLNEGEYMTRATKEEKSVYEIMHNFSDSEMEQILSAAQKVGKIEDPREVSNKLRSELPAVRYWALVALDAYEGDLETVKQYILPKLDDPSASVSIMAAEILIKKHENQEAYNTLENHLRSEIEPVVLQASISLRRTETHAAPLVEIVENEIMPRFSGDVWGRYKSWSYPMFIGMALDQTLINNGYNIDVR